MMVKKGEHLTDAVRQKIASSITGVHELGSNNQRIIGARKIEKICFDGPITNEKVLSIVVLKVNEIIEVLS